MNKATFNTSALNTSTLGAGNSTSAIFGTAVQALRLVGSLGVSLTKYGSATQTLKLDPQLHFIRRVYDSLALTLSVVGSLPARVWTQVFGAAYGLLRLDGSGKAVRTVFGTADQPMDLTYSATPRKLTAVHMSAATTMSMSGVNNGMDEYTGPAQDDRVLGAVDISTRTLSSVELGG